MDKSFKALASTLSLATLTVWLWRATVRSRSEQERLERMWRSSQALNQVSQVIMATTGDLSLLMNTVESVAKTMRYDHAGVFLRQDSGGLNLGVGYGYFLSPLFSVKKDEAQDIILPVLERDGGRGRVLYRQASGDHIVPNAPWQALFPLAARERTLGALVVASNTEPDHPDEAMSLGESLAALIAIGVQNINLYQQREELAAAAERDRLAREIHDGIAQHLYMLSLTLESCAELAEEGPAALKDRLGGALALSRSALLESRQYLLDLRPLLTGTGSLKDALQNLAKECATVGSQPIEFHVSGEERQASTDTTTGLYRVAQEAIANIFKHASATHINIKLDFQPDSITLEVDDNGVGFLSASPVSLPDDAPSSGHGLRNMRRRLEELGGSLEIITSPGNGASVIATVPAGSAA